MLNQNKVALSLGSFAALLHAVWSLKVWLWPDAMQWFLDWIFELHHLVNPLVITEFNLANAAMLVVATFVIWFVLGWVFAWVYNWVMARK
jgi:hypothetical protein